MIRFVDSLAQDFIIPLKSPGMLGMRLLEWETTFSSCCYRKNDSFEILPKKAQIYGGIIRSHCSAQCNIKKNENWLNTGHNIDWSGPEARPLYYVTFMNCIKTLLVLRQDF